MLITLKNKKALITTNFIFFNVIYLICIYFHIGEIRLLPTLELEKSIPFVPQALWLYISIQSFSYYIVVNSIDTLFIQRWFVSSLLFTLFCTALYQIFPTTINYENTFVLMSKGYTHSLLFHFRDISTGLNSFPSLFIGILTISTFLNLLHRSPKAFVYICLIPLFILSGLLIKQIYLSGAIASVLLGVIFSLLTYKFIHSESLL